MGDEIIQIENEKYDKDDVDNPRDTHQIDEKRDKDDADNEIVPRDSNNAHNGKQVSLVSLSPNGKYVITYSEDDKSIEGWIVKDSNLILDPEASVYNLPEESKYISDIKVNNSKIVCYIEDIKMKVFQMSAN
ncbi:hypothetical protein C1646_670331 [Rhizophagus diaphanus]|nr:hypothetical protein C1646_670331 [Rhizophagus diaphanus] [Rhizophagus sp. MUCL 43196]